MLLVFAQTILLVRNIQRTNSELHQRLSNNAVIMNSWSDPDLFAAAAQVELEFPRVSASAIVQAVSQAAQETEPQEEMPSLLEKTRRLLNTLTAHPRSSTEAVVH